MKPKKENLQETLDLLAEKLTEAQKTIQTLQEKLQSAPTQEQVQSLVLQLRQTRGENVKLREEIFVLRQERNNKV